MQSLLLIAVSFLGLGLAGNSSRSKKGELRAAQLISTTTFIYRPYTYQYGSTKWHSFNSSLPQAYITYFDGESEQDVKDRYSSEIQNASKKKMVRYKIGKLYAIFYPEEEILPDRWYGYKVDIYINGELVYEDTQGVYQTPSTLELCAIDDFLDVWSTPCSQLFLETDDHSTTRTWQPTTTPIAYQADYTTIKVTVGITVSLIIVVVILIIYCCGRRSLRAEIRNRRHAREQVTSVDGGPTINSDHDRVTETFVLEREASAPLANGVNAFSTPERTTTIPTSQADEDDPPPSYYDVISKEREQYFS